MKKKVVSIIGLAAIGAVAAFNANIGSRAESLSDIALANIEALADNEGGDTLSCCSYHCWADHYIFIEGVMYTDGSCWDVLDRMCPYGFAMWPC